MSTVQHQDIVRSNDDKMFLAAGNVAGHDESLPGGEGPPSSFSNLEKHSASPPPRPQDEVVHPDGGYGWVCTICCALINAHTWGLNSSYGVFLAHYLETNTFPGATYLEYAFVGGLSVSCAMLVSPLATLSTRQFGTHTTLSIGIAFETVSLIGASFASQIWQLFLSQGVAFGIGMGFLFVGSVAIPPQWFTTKRSLANGISACGSGFGGLLYSLAAGAMIRNIGLAWCFRVLGLVSFGVNLTCTTLIRDRNKAVGSRHVPFDTRLLKRPEYVLILAFGFFSMLGYIVLIFSLANYANNIGLDASQASIVSAIFNLGQGIGRPPIGYFSDTIGRLNMASMMTFLCGLFSLVIWIFARSYGVLIFFALIGGTVAGTFWATIAPVAVEVVGLQDVPAALSLAWLAIVLPCTFSEPIALEIKNGTGGYLSVQLFVGFMYIAASVCILFVRGWKIGEQDEIVRSKDATEATVTGEGDAELEENRARAVGRRTMWKDFLKWRKV